MVIPPESISTARLQLRLPVLADADAIFHGYAQDPAVTQYLTWRPHQEIAATQAFLRRCRHCWASADAFPWVISRRTDRALVGMIEVRIDGFRADLGYCIARHCWGRGYATEAVQAVTQWLLAQDGIYRVWATCDIENLASGRVLEKAGLQREGILRRFILHPNVSNEPRDAYCYAIVK